MITPEEKKFFDYWERNREREKNIFVQLRYGLPIGLLIAIAIILNFTTGWYERANMVAFSQSTPLALIFAVVVITLFCAIFFNRFKWERNEQRYKILLKRKELENAEGLMQHTGETGSQGGV